MPNSWAASGNPAERRSTQWVRFHRDRPDSFREPAMFRDAQTAPTTDPTPIFEAFRGSHATELLTAAVAHLGVFSTLAGGPRRSGVLRRVGIGGAAVRRFDHRPGVLGLLTVDADGTFATTALAAEHLTPGGDFDVSGYIGLAAESGRVGDGRAAPHQPTGGTRRRRPGRGLHLSRGDRLGDGTRSRPHAL